jgi:uncharacterized membrane protein YidH (DUF202 family)
MIFIFIIGIIFLYLNVLRFLIGAFQVLKKEEIPIYLKIWNFIESLGMLIVLIIITINYFKT